MKDKTSSKSKKFLKTSLPLLALAGAGLLRARLISKTPGLEAKEIKSENELNALLHNHLIEGHQEAYKELKDIYDDLEKSYLDNLKGKPIDYHTYLIFEEAGEHEKLNELKKENNHHSLKTHGDAINMIQEKIEKNHETLQKYIKDLREITEKHAKRNDLSDTTRKSLDFIAEQLKDIPVDIPKSEKDLKQHLSKTKQVLHTISETALNLKEVPEVLTAWEKANKQYHKLSALHGARHTYEKIIKGDIYTSHVQRGIFPPMKAVHLPPHIVISMISSPTPQSTHEAVKFISQRYKVDAGELITGHLTFSNPAMGGAYEPNKRIRLYSPLGLSPAVEAHELTHVIQGTRNNLHVHPYSLKTKEKVKEILSSLSPDARDYLNKLTKASRMAPEVGDFQTQEEFPFEVEVSSLLTEQEFVKRYGGGHLSGMMHAMMDIEHFIKDDTWKAMLEETIKKLRKKKIDPETQATLAYAAIAEPMYGLIRSKAMETLEEEGLPPL